MSGFKTGVLRRHGVAGIISAAASSGGINGVVVDDSEAPGTGDVLTGTGDTSAVWKTNPTWKRSVRVATTATGTLSTAYEAGDTVDGVVLAEGDRILIKDQSTGSQNGIYVVEASGAPSRAFDMDEDDEVIGAVVRVEAGTVNAATMWGVTNTTEPVLDTDSIVWAAAGGGGGSAITVQDEGTPLATAATTLNFTGSGVTASGTGATKTINVPGGAPDSADYLVGTANGGLTSEIVVGTTPGGELGGTWGSPTVDGTHSGSAHSDFVAKSLFDTKGDLLVASANDTGAKLAAGTDGYLLAARSGATNGLAYEAQYQSPPFIIDGGGLVITTGIKGDIGPFDYAGVIEAVTLLADQAGAIVIDIWKDTYTNFPPVVGDSITASALPTIAATNDHSQDTTLTGWSTGKTISVGDILRFNVVSVTSITRVTLSLKIRRT